MFTGLIEDVGILRERCEQGATGTLTVRTDMPVTDIQDGDSIAVNGACLTVESKDEARGNLAFQTLSEPLSRTNLGQIPLGGRLNLERALRLSDRLGGHLVSGHVDATAKILAVARETDDFVVRIALPGQLAPLVIPKGSIAVNGISLTIADLSVDSFSVHIIPHTWRHTNLAEAKTGDEVNLEADMAGKYILRQNQADAPEKPPLTLEDLHRAGFN